MLDLSFEGLSPSVDNSVMLRRLVSKLTPPLASLPDVTCSEGHTSFCFKSRVLVLNLLKELVRIVFTFKAFLAQAFKMFENFEAFLGRCISLCS